MIDKLAIPERLLLYRTLIAKLYSNVSNVLVGLLKK